MNLKDPFRPHLECDTLDVPILEPDVRLHSIHDMPSNHDYDK